MTRSRKFDDVIIRWTFGETTARPMSPRTISILETSVRLARCPFPSARQSICYNNASAKTERKISLIGKGNGAELIDVSQMLSRKLGKCQKKDSWWKYAIPRTDLGPYEISIDNDVVLWKVPSTLLKGIKEGALLALTDAAGRFYGDFSRMVLEADSDLMLNAGLFGMPPGFSPDFDLLECVRLGDNFHSEQGFTAINFILHEGPKFLVPLHEVQQLNIHRVAPEEPVSSHSGGHFCGCSYGYHELLGEIPRAYCEEKVSECVERLAH